MACFAGADLRVAGGFFAAACIARHCVEHALGVLEDRLHAPEAASCKHCGGRCRGLLPAAAMSTTGGGSATAGLAPDVAPAYSNAASMPAPTSTSNFEP